MKLYPGLNSGLENVRIGTKLTLAFLIVLSLTLMLGGFSIIKLAIGTAQVAPHPPFSTNTCVLMCLVSMAYPALV